MRIVKINTGLGNQMFQYVFLRYIEEKTGEKCIIDDIEAMNTDPEFTKNPARNGYEIERVFNLKPRRLSQELDPDVFDELVKMTGRPTKFGDKYRGLVAAFKEVGVELFTVQEGNAYELECTEPGSLFSTPWNEYYPDVVNFKGDIYYYGFWINAKWFYEIAKTLLKELVFPELTDERNKQYMSQIKSAGEHSLALHVRRGDFVTIGCAIDSSMYKNMMDSIREKVEKPEIFVFSDDIPWVKEHSLELGLKPSDEIVYVEGNYREKSYIDAQLMKECRGMVYSNSSFSYFASLLNTRPDKVVCQPTTREVIFYN